MPWQATSCCILLKMNLYPYYSKYILNVNSSCDVLLGTTFPLLKSTYQNQNHSAKNFTLQDRIFNENDEEMLHKAFQKCPLKLLTLKKRKKKKRRLP